MEETFYKTVKYPENKPETKEPVMTDCGWLSFRDGKWYRRIDTETPMPSPEWWLKPLPILSRDKMIEVIRDYYKKKYDESVDTDNGIETKIIFEEIADAILKSGLPEKKVEIKKLRVSELRRVDEYMGVLTCDICHYPKVKTEHSFCPGCGSKITWI